MRIKFSVKNALILICVLYTLLTITSSGLGLLTGSTTSDHVHLLMRFAVTAIGIGSILLFNLFPQWSLVKIYAFHYAVTMSIVLLSMWISGFFIELHPDAYRDIFLNFTPIYILVSLGLQFAGRIKKSSVSQT